MTTIRKGNWKNVPLRSQMEKNGESQRLPFNDLSSQPPPVTSRNINKLLRQFLNQNLRRVCALYVRVWARKCVH